MRRLRSRGFCSSASAPTLRLHRFGEARQAETGADVRQAMQATRRTPETKQGRVARSVRSNDPHVKQRSSGVHASASDQGVDMKSRIAMAALAASLLVTAGLASAQQTYYRTAQVPGQASADTWTDPAAPQQSAMQGQSGDTSYGGSPMTRGAAGATTMGTMDSSASKPCTRGPQCNIFFGN
jgi:hypothetical protein